MLTLLIALSLLALLLLIGLGLTSWWWLRARRERREAQRTLADAIEALPACIEIFDADDRLVAYNQRLLELFPHLEGVIEPGMKFADLLRKSIERGGIPSIFGQEEAWVEDRLTQRGHSSEPLLHEIAGDRWVHVYERRTASGGMVGVRIDVTALVKEKQRLSASQAHLQALIAAASNGILTLDHGGHVLDANPACERLLGYEPGQLRGSHLSLLIKDLSTQTPIAGSAEMQARHREGHELDVHLALAEVRSPGTHHFVAILTDFSERRRQEVRLRQANELLARQAVTDGLTQVGNRRLFDTALQMEWQRGTRSGRSLALLMVDIDHFKLYNDRYGHVAGDDCLRRVASLLSASLGRSGEMLCRYGGEEFAVLLIDTDLAGARVVGQRFLDSLHLAAIEHLASPLGRSVTISIGIAAEVPSRERDPKHLVELADQALYDAKQAGRDRMSVTAALKAVRSKSSAAA